MIPLAPIILHRFIGVDFLKDLSPSITISENDRIVTNAETEGKYCVSQRRNIDAGAVFIIFSTMNVEKRKSLSDKIVTLIQ